jgi:hypothetical protein
MTLIVYKDGVLAADTRATHHCSSHNDTNCAHCGKKATAVNDTEQKISLTVGRKAIATFRGEKVLVMASAGHVGWLNRIQRIISSGKNLEEVFENYLSVNGTNSERDGNCMTVLICETSNYSIRVPRKGSLVVEKVEKDKFILIGSGAEAASWINRLLPHLTAPQIVNLAMHKEVSVGGEIDFVDLSKQELVIERHGKLEPQSMLDAMVSTFKRGREALIEDNKKTKPPRKRVATKGKEK